MTANLLWTGAPCKISPRGASVMIREVWNQPRTKQHTMKYVKVLVVV